MGWWKQFWCAHDWVDEHGNPCFHNRSYQPKVDETDCVCLGCGKVLLNGSERKKSFSKLKLVKYGASAQNGELSKVERQDVSGSRKVRKAKQVDE